MPTAPIISLIVAMAENRAIGCDGGLPWCLPDDLRRFKKLTMGHPVIMGRKTWDSIGRPLTGRRLIVLSRQENWSAVGAEHAPSLDAALSTVGGSEVFVIGGGAVFADALPRAGRLFLTRVHADVEGDVFMPSFEDDGWYRVNGSDPARHTADERHEHAFSFEDYVRG